MTTYVLSGEDSYTKHIAILALGGGVGYESTLKGLYTPKTVP